MKNTIVLFIMYLCFGIISSGYTQTPVKYYGKLMSVMNGDLDAKFDLENLQSEKHIYGIGAVESLKGEITIIDGIPFIATVKKGKLEIKQDFNRKAALYINAKVSNWKSVDVNQTINDTKELENYLNQQFEKDSSLSNQPIPFLIKGKIKSLSWHVIDWIEGDTVHTHKKHKKSGMHGTIKNREVTVIGFYSEFHHGIITHRSSNVHMHFITRDQALSGHIDEVAFDDVVLYYSG